LESMQKWKWASARIVFLVVALTGAASGGISAYLLGPLYSWYFFNDIRFLRHHRMFLPLLVAFWKLVFEWFRRYEYRGMFAIPLTAPPMMGPDISLVRVRPTWPETDGACNGCIECCIRRACPLLDPERKRCRSYGSFFWRYFNCGRYPESDDQILYYDCHKWEVIPRQDPTEKEMSTY
jgi:hypothetical protein